MPERQSMLVSRFIRLSLTLLCVVVAVLVLVTPYTSRNRHLSVSNARYTSSVYNRTLGFQTVFAIGFEDRTDKRDALTLAAHFSEFDIRWSEGVRVELIPEKAIPEIFENTTFKDRAIGTWRAHLNVLQTIVREGIETALVFEDDNDWDINLKAQLEVFAEGVSALQRKTPGNSPRGSPYGNNWDNFWLGHCHTGPKGEWPEGPNQQMYFIKNDRTVPPWPERYGWWDNPHIIPEVLSNTTRIIFRSGSGMCMWGHAYTLQAARKILTILSLEAGSGRQIDGAIGQLAEQGDLKSYSIYPPILSSHRFAGSKYRDSDIMDKSENSYHDAFTYNIVYSVLLNMLSLVKGATEVRSQWPDGNTIPVRRLDEPYASELFTEMREVNLKEVPKYSIYGVNVKGRFDTKGYNGLVSELQLRE